MARKYPYQQLCPVARSLEIVGDRWTLLLIRDLAQGHSKYGDLLSTLRGISSNVLSERLKLLEREGLVSSSLYSDHPPRAEYRLTDKGEAILPVLRAFTAWGEAYAPRKAKPATENPNSA